MRKYLKGSIILAAVILCAAVLGLALHQHHEGESFECIICHMAHAWVLPVGLLSLLFAGLLPPRFPRIHQIAAHGLDYFQDRASRAPPFCLA